jgi:uncharacterized membrane protein
MPINEREELRRALIAYAVEQFAEGKTRAAVVQDLKAKGITPSVAGAIADIAGRSKVRHTRTILHIGFGLLLLAIGVVLSLESYRSAEPGGSYVVTTGLILVGLYPILEGVAPLLPWSKSGITRLSADVIPGRRLTSA